MNYADEQLERMVSETIEPFETLPPNSGRHQSQLKVSPLQAWHEEIWDNESRGWQHAPWLSSDDYAMRLFDEMPDPMIWRESATLWGAEAQQGGFAFDKDRRKAIVLAYLKMNGKL